MISTSRTFTGKDVQEATAAALEALNAELEDVDIRVISPGKPGIFGLGGALAEIEVSVAGAEVTSAPDIDELDDDLDESRERGRQGRRGGQQRRQQQRPRQQRRSQQRQPRERSARQGSTGGGRQSQRSRQSGRRDDDHAMRASRERHSRDRDARDQDARSAPEPARTMARDPEPIEELTPEIRQQLEEVTSEVLGKLIANMQVQVDAYVLDDLRDGSLVFEIEGDDAGLLIGRRGETLRDLQSIVRLLVGRRLQRRPNIIIDVEQYQDRRRNRLQDIAERAARNATRSGQDRLEPMSSDERRLIHMALAEHPNVVTESEGEGDDRHVVVKAVD